MRKLLPALLAFTALTGAAMAQDANDMPNESSYMGTTVHALSPDKMVAFRKTMQEASDENKDLYRQLHQAHQELYTLLAAPNFDQRTFSAKAAQVRDLQADIEKNKQEAFASAVADMSPADRKQLAENIERHHEMMHQEREEHHHHHHHHRAAQGASENNAHDNGGVGNSSNAIGNEAPATTDATVKH